MVELLNMLFIYEATKKKKKKKKKKNRKNRKNNNETKTVNVRL
jgi:hypothetical protein